MRFGLRLVCCGLGLALGGCSGGYPLPPTRCDEWCDATKGRMCEDYYEPASCVAQCEQAQLDVEACRSQFDAVLSCFRHSPGVLHQACVYDGKPDDCDTQLSVFDACITQQALPQLLR
jgi:hypothetical protein